MLAGKKPLATFFDAEGYWSELLQRYIRMFDRHIGNGTLIRRDHFIYPTINDKRTWHRILFALPAEEWRIDAMIDLLSDDTWSPAHERREGELLGYEDWMNDFHLARNSQS